MEQISGKSVVNKLKESVNLGQRLEEFLDLLSKDKYLFWTKSYVKTENIDCLLVDVTKLICFMSYK